MQTTPFAYARPVAEIEYMGRLSDQIVPQETLTLPATVTTITALRECLAIRHDTPHLDTPSVRAVVNDVLVPDSHAITDADTIAFLPPVGGG